jgi:hypothetical protein
MMNFSTVTCQTEGCINNGVAQNIVAEEGELVQCGECGTEVEAVLTDIEISTEDWQTPEAQKRLERNDLLNQSDLKMLPDAPWDTTAWATYRQALRDLPADPAWPDVDFPVAPE